MLCASVSDLCLLERPGCGEPNVTMIQEMALEMLWDCLNNSLDIILSFELGKSLLNPAALKEQY